MAQPLPLIARAAVASGLVTAALAWQRTAPAAAPAVLHVGYAEADVTPPLGGSMPGYFGDRRATGTLDPLKSKVLYLRKGGESVAIVACDLIAVGEPLAQRIRKAMADSVRPAPRHVWVHATHTHTGGMIPREGTFTSDTEKIYPEFYPGQVDTTWVDTLVRKTAEAVGRAAAEAAPESAPTLHEGREETVAFYRRFRMRDGSVRTNPGRSNPEVVEPAGTIDPRVHLLRFPDRKVVTVLYGLHPDCVSGTQYSADYPAHLSEALRERLGADWRVVFLNTCCGNINHIDVKNAAQKSGPEESRRIGRQLAASALAALAKGGEALSGPLQARSTGVKSRLRRPTPEELTEARERLRTGKDAFEFNGLFAPAAVVLAETRDREHTARVTALRLGQFGLAALPGEVFVELARQVEADSPLAVTRTIGLTNGAMGYIPHRQGYAEGGYEAGYRSARYVPGTGESWATAAAGLLRKMEGER
ncbi:MAG: hypothetical protein ACK47B_04530 [Armatimonadota bacterium]